MAPAPQSTSQVNINHSALNPSQSDLEEHLHKLEDELTAWRSHAGELNEEAQFYFENLCRSKVAIHSTVLVFAALLLGIAIGLLLHL